MKTLKVENDKHWMETDVIILNNSVVPSILFLSDDQTSMSTMLIPTISENGMQMYIVSDEPILAGDWYYDTSAHKIDQLDADELPMSYDRKIIATTDSSLRHVCGYEDVTNMPMYVPLPQIPIAFIVTYIKSYNQGKKIDNALVEYVQGYNNNLSIYPDVWQMFVHKNNIINIKKLQSTWTAEEMYLNMQYYMEYCRMEGYVTPQEWIEKYKHF